MHQGRALFEGFLHVHDRWQLLDIELDRLSRIARLRIGLGHYGSNRIPHMTDFALCQHRMPRLLHHFAKTVRHLPATGQTAHTLEILASKNPQDPRHGLGCAGIHLVQPPVRHIRAQEIHIGLPAQIDVIGVIAVSGQKPDILAPLGAGANASVFRHIILLPDRTGFAPMITRSAFTVPQILRGSAAGGQNRFDDVVIARAAAEIALKIIAYLGLGGRRVLGQQRRCRHHHARRAESALQPVMILKRLLNRMQRAIRLGHALDGLDFGPLSLGGEHGAGLHRLAIHMHHTGPTLAGVTAHMRACQAKGLSQKFDKKRAALNLARRWLAIHGHFDLRHWLLPV